MGCNSTEQNEISVFLVPRTFPERNNPEHENPECKNPDCKNPEKHKNPESGAKLGEGERDKAR